MSPSSRPSWSLLFEDFHCRGCGAQEAYRSRARGLFERYVLPVLFMQPVRCDHCYLRSYIPRTVAARERALPMRKEPESQPGAGTNAGSRIA